MGTGRTARYHWNFPICPTRVTIDLSVIRALQIDLLAAGEQHGFLYGKETEGATHINGREAIPAPGRAAVETSIRLARRAPVGYYRIRDGRAFMLTNEEIDVANELFRRPGAVVLLMERRGLAAAEATFFFWRGDAFVSNLPMPFPLDADRLAAGDTATTPLTLPGVAKGSFFTARRTAAIAAAGTVLGLGFVAMALRNPSKATAARGVAAPPALSRPAVVDAARPGGPLEFVWDPKSMPAATAGLLEVNDGGVRRSIPLDFEQLRTGAFEYLPSSDQVKVELSTLQRDGHVVDNDVAVRLGSNSAHGPVEPPAGPAPTIESAPAPAPQPPPVQPQPRRTADAAPISSADRRIALKPFRPAPGSLATSSAAPVVLDPPAVEVTPVSAALLPIAPSLRPHLPPPAPAAPTRFVASAGRLIWTGTLTRRGVVELDGRSASVGSISGALPGVPVNVSISPAEFEGDALVVYTGDAARNQRVEPASAATGWNKVKWVWDPARVQEISVIEPPNRSNNFNRLAFRNEARRTSIVWIDWRAR